MSYPVLSKQAFRNWALSRDPNETYNWSDTQYCAIAQYAKSLGFKGVRANIVDFAAYTGRRRGFLGLFAEYKKFKIEGLNGEEIAKGAYGRENTFGNLAKALA